MHKVTLSSGTVAPVARTVGFKRDAVINLKPSAPVQETLSGYSKSVFGPNFALWSAQKIPIPYHLTIGQASKMSETLSKIFDQAKTASAETASSFAP